MAGNRTIRYTKLMVGSLDVGTHLENGTKHRLINDSGTSVTELWSASKVDGEVTTLENAIAAISGVSNAAVTVSGADPTPDVSSGLTIISITAASAQDVQTIDGGTIRDMAIFYAESDYVTFVDATGNISLKGDPSALDFPMNAGDVLALIFDGTTWKELYRTLA